MLGTGKTFYEYFFSSPEKIFSTIISAGHSVFFFLFSLILLSLLLHTLLRFPSISESSTWVSVLFVISLISLLLVPKFLKSHGIDLTLYNPLNFLPYVFSALLINQLTKHNHAYPSLIFVFFVFWVGAAVTEWRHLDSFTGMANHILPPYARISNVLGAMTLTLAASYVFQKPSRIISFLSLYSIGIYCIHSFKFTYAFSNALFSNVLLGTSLFLFCSTLFDSFILTASMRRQNLLKRFV
jgi:hypothetical protein